jgi:CRP-like cAMP-binding protein
MADKDAARVELLAAARAHQRAKAAVERTREVLHARIVRAGAAGMTKSQIGRDTGYTREYVTKLLAEAGVKAEAE